MVQSFGPAPVRLFTMSKTSPQNPAPQPEADHPQPAKGVVRSEQDLKAWADQLKAREAALKKLAEELDKRFHKAT